MIGMLTWIGILVSHVGFIKATKAQQIPDDRFPYRSPFGLVGSYIALAFLSILILTKSFDVFVGGFDYKGFIVGYIGLPVYLTLLFGYKFWCGTKRVKNSEADLVTGVPTTSFAEERALHEAEMRERAKHQTGVARVIGQVYRRTLAWLF
jgi:amino acid transporter